MKFVLKHKFEIIILFILTLLFFLLRLPNLTSQPIFADEAIYIRWAQIMKAEPTLRYISMQDGKTPLFMWAMIPFFKVFADPLFAGRFLSVLAGLFTMLGVFALSARVFNTRVALWATLIYVVLPFMVFFDRMALVDSMLAGFTIWALYFAIWLLQKPRLDLAMITGYLLGFAWMTKTPALLNLIALPATIIGVNFKSISRKELLKLLLFWGVAILFAQIMYNSLRLGPEFNQLSARNGDYVFSIAELKGRPLDPFIPHLHDVTDWFQRLVTWPITALIFIGIGFAIKTKNRLSWGVLAWTLVPLIILMTFLRTFTARYILLCIPPLIIFGGYGLDLIYLKLRSTNKLAPLAVILFFPLALMNSYLIVTDIAKADLSRNERSGYLEDWTAGYGFKEIAAYLREQNQQLPIVIGTAGFFGTLPDGLYIYLDKANIPIVGSNGLVSAELKNSIKLKPTYYVANDDKRVIVTDAILIQEYPKALPPTKKPQQAIKLYKLIPPKP
ncbi:MAG: glycosyltransferase family 39 protein [Candidatus Daviesbacteria bacterium]|nr:glycosyltransferase family 39 protein [Candidatus Daviesbacteria bacterium]